MNFKIITLERQIDGIVVIEPTLYEDQRGFFMETYSEKLFSELGIPERFVQDNHSLSARGVLRGMHFQRKNPQGKLVRVSRGAVLDIAVDLRKGSKTLGEWFSVELSSENRRMIYIPPHFAHGFLALEEETELLYKCTDYYSPSSEAGLRWDDPSVGINWELSKYGIDAKKLIISGRDLQLKTFDKLDISTLWI